MKTFAHCAVAALSAILAGCGSGSSGSNATAPTGSSVALDPGQTLTTIAFGSCAEEESAQPIWGSILSSDPDLFLFLGDNVYADLWKEDGKIVMETPPDASYIQRAYDDMAARPEWQRFSAAVPVMATWDDHDFGDDDAGAEWHMKDDAQRMLLEFFNEPRDSDRWTRPGVYTAKTFGPEGRRVQVILLDTRYFRSPLTKRTDEERAAGRAVGSGGPYKPNATGQGTLLGEAQWSWLEEQLRQPADVRIIASSIQVLADEHGWETWGNMPHEREKLFGMIESTGANGVVLLSGDRHLMELSVDTASGPYPMWDFTSSGFNWPSSRVNEPNSLRKGGVFREPNYGLIRIEWAEEPGEETVIVFDGRDGMGSELIKRRVALRALRVR